MKKQQIKNLSEEQILAEIKQRKKEKYNIRFQKAAGEEINLARTKIIRKEIARLLTEINQRNKINAKNK